MGCNVSIFSDVDNDLEMSRLPLSMDLLQTNQPFSVTSAPTCWVETGTVDLPRLHVEKDLM